MTELERVWNFCEQKKNACDKNVEVIGMDNMLTPPWQTNMGMSNAYWSVQKCIEIIEEERKTNADRIRSMSDEESAEWLTSITADAQSDAKTRCDYQWSEWLKEESAQQRNQRFVPVLKGDFK